MTFPIIKLWISYYIYKYILLFKFAINIQYLFLLFHLLPSTIIVYINCILSNHLLSLLSILDINEYTPYSCKYHQTYFLSLKENILSTFKTFPIIFIKHFSHPFKDLDEYKWNQIVLELI